MSAKATLPETIEFRRAALDGATRAGRLTLRNLPRTREAVIPQSTADVSVELVFSEDGQRRAMVSGRIRTTLMLACQRCLEAAVVPMDVAVAAMIATSDAAAASVPRDWEPVLVEDERLDLHALVDDELLLALPISVHCDRAECQALVARYRQDDTASVEEETTDSETNNPFAALANLRLDRDDTN